MAQWARERESERGGISIMLLSLLGMTGGAKACSPTSVHARERGDRAGLDCGEGEGKRGEGRKRRVSWARPRGRRGEEGKEARPRASESLLRLIV